MSESTLQNTLSPEGALVVLRGLLPECMVPTSVTALLSASKRPGGPPSRLITNGVPGRGRRRYDPAELREWALGQLPEKVHLAVRYLTLAESAAGLGLITSPDPPLGEYSAGVSIIGEEGLAEYVGDLEGAEEWLRERAGKAVKP